FISVSVKWRGLKLSITTTILPLGFLFLIREIHEVLLLRILMEIPGEEEEQGDQLPRKEQRFLQIVEGHPDTRRAGKVEYKLIIH
ncbi:MAG: hypothetical protein QXQ46_11770, partial [Thermoplasmatales archaeon]